MSESRSAPSHPQPPTAPEGERKVRWIGPFLTWTGWILAVVSLFLGGYLVSHLKSAMADRDQKIQNLEQENERLRNTVKN